MQGGSYPLDARWENSENPSCGEVEHAEGSSALERDCTQDSSKDPSEM